MADFCVCLFLSVSVCVYVYVCECVAINGAHIITNASKWCPREMRNESANENGGKVMASVYVCMRAFFRCLTFNTN